MNTMRDFSMWNLSPEHLSDESPLEGPPIPFTIDMAKKAISKMKSGKPAGPLGVLVMIRAAGDTGASMIRNLAIATIRDGRGGGSKLTGSRASLSAFTREKAMLWTEATIKD